MNFKPYNFDSFDDLKHYQRCEAHKKYLHMKPQWNPKTEAHIKNYRSVIYFLWLTYLLVDLKAVAAY